MGIFREFMLGRYKKKTKLNIFFNIFYIIILGLLFCGENSIGFKISVFLLFVLFVIREIVEFKIRKNIEKASYNQYFCSILLSILESATLMGFIFLVAGIDLFGLIVGVFLAFQINMETKVLMEFRRLYKEQYGGK